MSDLFIIHFLLPDTSVFLTLSGVVLAIGFLNILSRPGVRVVKTLATSDMLRVAQQFTDVRSNANP